MLTHLQIQNFIIIQHLELDFENGLTVITGETGAGKSIILEALDLLLGGRVTTDFLVDTTEKCHLTACFNLEQIPSVRTWLQQHDFGMEIETECIIRRVLYKEGKSRQMINGFPCTLQQLRELASLFINIHSQNQHLQLTKRTYQRELLDNFANHLDLCDQVKNSYQLWLENQKKLEEIEQLSVNRVTQQELLEFQIQEFEKIGLQPNEYSELDQEQKQLSNAQMLIQLCQDAMRHLSEEENSSAQNRLYQTQHLLTSIRHHHERLNTANDLIQNAIIHVKEAASELRAYLNQIVVDPQRLNFVERRLSKLHELGRKYHIQPHLLNDVQQRLMHQLEELTGISQKYEDLQRRSEELKAKYLETAQLLTSSRQQAAKKLSKQIENQLRFLSMPEGLFQVAITELDQILAYGKDEINFLVATNPGQSLQPLAKIASGGEISRIALAIYVITAQIKTTPILIFDEVDIGIGGGTASIVGSLLKTLSKRCQVLCITHLPQVAAYGDQHFFVKKQHHKNYTLTHIIKLEEDDRVQEVARMLGGITMSDKTLAHAKELVTCAIED